MNLETKRNLWRAWALAGLVLVIGGIVVAMGIGIGETDPVAAFGRGIFSVLVGISTIAKGAREVIRLNDAIYLQQAEAIEKFLREQADGTMS